MRFPDARPAVPIAILVFSLLIATAGTVRSQTVVGTVVDAASAEPLDAVELVLVNSRGVIAVVGITGEDGRFTLIAPHTGTYQVRAHRIGYAEAATPHFDLLPDDTVQVVVRIGVDAVAIEPIRVTSERGPLVLDRRLERFGFYERQYFYGASGSGEFFDYDDIQERGLVLRTSDLFRLSRRIRIRHTGGRGIEIRGASGCRPSYVLNGNPARLRGDRIDEVIHPSEVVAVEFYMGTIGPWGSCVIAIWTGYHDSMAGDSS